MTSAVPAQPNISIFRVTSILVKQLHTRITNVHFHSMTSRIHLPSKASYYDSTRTFSPSVWTNRERTGRCAGPLRTAPDVTSNLLPWHGHVTVVPYSFPF